MPMPRAFRSIARVLNPAILPIARRVPPLAVIGHVGRRTGRRYASPVMAFGSGEGWVVALAYGPDVDWVANVEYAGGAEITQGGQRHRLGQVHRIAQEEGAGLLPSWARVLIGAARPSGYLLLSRGLVSQAGL